MTAVRVMAVYSFTRAIRQQAYLLTLGLALLLIAVTALLSFHGVSAQPRVAREISMLLMATVAFFLTLFVAADLWRGDRESGAFLMLAAHPVSRGHLVLGKFLGFAGLLALNLIPLGLGLVGVDRLLSGAFHPDLLTGVWLLMWKFCVFGSLVLFLSTFLTALITPFASVFFFVCTHLSAWIQETVLAGASPWAERLAAVLFTLLPDLSVFDVRTSIVHEHAVPSWFLLGATAYGFCYTAAFLAATFWVVEEAEL